MELYKSSEESKTSDSFRFVQLAERDIKLGNLINGDLISSMDNGLILFGSNNQVILLEMFTENTAFKTTLPYALYPLKIPQERPLAQLLRSVPLDDIFEKSNVLERQTLTLDPIYKSHVSSVKVDVIEAHWMPSPKEDKRKFFTILNSCGACNMYKREEIVTEWLPITTNISDLLLNDTFSKATAVLKDVKNFVKLRDFIYLYWITSLCWHNSESIIYLGTAAGYIVSMKFNVILERFELCSYVETTLGHIIYMKNYKDFLLACDLDGRVQLFRISTNGQQPVLLEILYNKRDLITFRKAIISYDKSTNSYLIVFCKSCNMLAFCLSHEGKIISQNRLVLTGIKVTGLENMTKNEFVVTTVMGLIHYIRIIFDMVDNTKMTFYIQRIEHKFCRNHLQIMGLGRSRNCYLWSILLYRNKNYTHLSKNRNSTAFIKICKLNNMDTMSIMLDPNISCFDQIPDAVVTFSLEICKNTDSHLYQNYINLKTETFQRPIDKNLHRRFQVKLFILRHIMNRQNIYSDNNSDISSDEYKFCEFAIQILYIIQRLKYLKQLMFRSTITAFQQLSIACMQAAYTRLQVQLNDMQNNNNLNETIQNYINITNFEFTACKFSQEQICLSLDDMKEHCTFCRSIIDRIDNDDQCPKGHKIRRCCISYTQLPLFKNTYCPLCYAAALPIDQYHYLEQLFPDDNYEIESENASITGKTFFVLKCPFCSYGFKFDDF